MTSHRRLTVLSSNMRHPVPQRPAIGVNVDASFAVIGSEPDDDGANGAEGADGAVDD